MSFESTKTLPALVQPVLIELQGLRFSTVAGAGAGVAIAVAAIKPEDTIVCAIEVVATTADLVDHLSDITIVDPRATATLTLTDAVAGNACAVRGKTYTMRAVPADGQATYEVLLGDSDTATAANLAAAISRYDGNNVSATSDAGVVTVVANAAGTAGNSFALVGSTNIVASHAHLEGGAATGSVKIGAATTGSKIILGWVNKR